MNFSGLVHALAIIVLLIQHQLVGKQGSQHESVLEHLFLQLVLCMSAGAGLSVHLTRVGCTQVSGSVDM